MLIDLHTHSKPWSEDSLLTLPELIQLEKKAGLDAICITEHEYFWNKDELAELGRKHNFLILPGVEINTEEGHFLVFGVEKYVLGMYRARYLKAFVDELGGAMILAHPYRRQIYEGENFEQAVELYLKEPISDFVDTLEVLNGKATARENKFSQEICRRLNLRGVGGGDAHSTLEIPSCATLFERKINTVEELITELKAGRFKAVDLRHK